MRLKISEDGQPPTEVEIPPGTVTLGRSTGNDVVLKQGFVSGKHLRLCRGLLVEDLGSRNGTFLDGEPVREPELIGDRRLTVGGKTLAIEVVHAADDDLGRVLAREVAARVGATPGGTAGGRPAGNGAVPRAASGLSPTRALLERMVRDDHHGTDLSDDTSIDEIYAYESFKFVRNAEHIVSRLAADLTKKLSLNTQLPGSDDNFRTLMARLFVDGGQARSQEDLAVYLDKLLGWLFASVQVYQEAAIALADEICGTLKPDALLRLGEIPPHLRILRLDRLVLWQRAQERLDEMSTNYIIDRLDALARIAASKHLDD